MSEEESFEELFEKFKADVKESNSKHEETMKQMFEEKGKKISEMIETAEKRNSFEFLEHSFVNIVHVQSVAVENEDDLSKKQCLEVTRVTSFWIWRQLELCEEEFIRTAHYVDACYPKEGKKAMKEMMEQHEKEMANTKPSNIMEIEQEKGLEKVFRLKTTIEGGLTNCYAKLVSKDVYHFGIPWKCQIRRTKEDQLNVTVKWGPKFSSLNAEDEIEIKYELKTGNGFTKQGEHFFVKERNKSAKFQIATLPLSEAVMVDNPGLLKLSINALVTFKRSVEENDVFFQFGATKRKFSDFLLLVGGQKFYVLKKYLAMQSSYFQKLFNVASQKPEITQIVLHGVEAKDFQLFLDVLQGKYYEIVHYGTVEIILLMNSVYNGKHVAERCEEFLMKANLMTMEKKIALASRYNLKNVLINCLSEITNADQIQELLNNEDLDMSTRQALLEKASSF
ncbi:hypothetical protein B9Z55_022829 [Caenorhabditis nigoni]|uniref:BTB domain-containing protein n=1 Tax=Caenorhabditis nigoni TaxID=1611254 RepID=A0A2G5SM17_9PELO|nr:hypothetical protein B9Z55_022829 [Caenorhabditis nigoni]